MKESKSPLRMFYVCSLAYRVIRKLPAIHLAASAQKSEIEILNTRISGAVAESSLSGQPASGRRARAVLQRRAPAALRSPR